MISTSSLQFYMNAAFEMVAIIFVAIVFASSLMKKKGSFTKASFCLFSLNLMVLLLCNMITWILDAQGVSPTYKPGLYSLNIALTMADFFFYCLAGVMFYNYVDTVIYGLNKAAGVKAKRHTRLVMILVLQCLVSEGIFLTSIENGWLYYFAEDGYTYYTIWYWVLVVISIISVWISFVTIIKNRKLIGGKKTGLLLSYLVVPMILLVADQLFGYSFSYLSLAFIVEIIYVEVDLLQTKELLEQEAAIAIQGAEMTELKFNLMMNQIQPHFLYNSLSSIAYLCRKDPKEAEVAVNEFSDYLRMNLQNITSSKIIDFATELNHVETYLKIQKRRFPQQMQVEYDIQTVDFGIPPLTLQPIVENAVKHGVEASFDLTTIWISTEGNDEEVIIVVKDNGPGFDVNQPPKNDRQHIGMSSAKVRLAEMVHGTLNIESELGAGTTVTITIPKGREE